MSEKPVDGGSRPALGESECTPESESLVTVESLATAAELDEMDITRDLIAAARDRAGASKPRG